MPISQTDQLFSLIKTLTKSEKRNFRLFVNRITDANSALFMQLFDLFDKQKSLNEEEVFKKLKIGDKGKFSNLKRHLYSQIMTSLEQIHRQKRTDLQIRELLNFAHILYGKGLYLQALKLLQKAKVKAKDNFYDLHYLSILEFEKKIQSRHITRSGAEYNLELVEASEAWNEQTHRAVILSNLRLWIHNVYIRRGHIKSEAEALEIGEQFFNKLPPNLQEEEMSVKERAYLYQSFVWYNFILLNFVECYRYAVKWVTLFKDSPKMATRDPDLMMRGYHYLLVSAYNNKDVTNHRRYLDEVEKYRKENYKKFNNISQIMSFLYVHNGRLNSYFLEGNFKEGVEIAVPKTLRRIQRYGNKLDPHRIMTFYFKIAWMYLGAEQADKCVEYCQKVINMNMQNLRTDLQIFTRLLFLMAHYDLQNEDIMEYLVRNTRTFIKQQEKPTELAELCLDFFRKIVTIAPADRRANFIEFADKLKYLQAQEYQKRAFFYLDIPAWVESKVKRISLSEVVRK